VWRISQSANGPQLYFDFDNGFPAPGWSLGFGQFYIDGQGYYWLQDADWTLHKMAMGSGTSPGQGLHTIDGTLIDMPMVNGQYNAQYPDGRTVIYGALNHFAGFFYPVEIVDANGNMITIQYVNGEGPAIQEIHDTLGRVISFHYDANNLLTAVTAPGLNGTTRTVVRFHYKPVTVSGFVSITFQGIDAIYFPGTSTGYWFGDPDSYTENSGIIAKVSQRRAMTLEAGCLNEQGTVTAGTMTRERIYNYDPSVQGPNLPAYTTMTESWAGMDPPPPPDPPPAVTTYTVTPGWTIETVHPDGTTERQYLNDHPGWFDDLLLWQTEISGVQTQLAWEQGDYESPRISSVNEVRLFVRPGGNEIRSKLTRYIYSSPANQLTDIMQFDYLSSLPGSTSTGALLRQIHTDYQPDPGYAGRHIFNLPAQAVISGPDGVAASRTDYEYDAGNLADAPGVVGHSDPGTNYRGNITQITRFADAANYLNDVIESRQYDICGNLIIRSGQPYDQMTYTYDLGTQYAYPSAVTWGAADPSSSARLTRSFSYDFGTGLLLTSTDPNGGITQYAYDPATLRLQQMTLPAGGYILYSYDDSADMGTFRSVSAGGEPAGETAVFFNGLGLVQSVLISGEDNSLNAVTTQYDSMGRIWKRSQPYAWGSSPAWTVFSYDGLGRITSVQDPGGAQWTWYYDELQRPDSASAEDGDTVRVQSPAITWLGKTVNGTDRWYRTDALGFLAEVAQPNAYGTWPGGSVLDPGSVKTAYSYNALGLLVGVTQGPQGQQRSFRYDSLGRLTAQYVPEKTMTLDDTGTYVGPGNLARWSDVFTYDNWSNLASHTDARGVQTLYTYAANPLDPPDPLNRLYYVSYESHGAAPYIAPTAPIDYAYVTSGDVTRLAQVTTTPLRSGQATQNYSYDTEGRLATRQLICSTATTAFPALELDYAYDSLNRLTEVTYPTELGVAGRKNIGYSYDTASGLLASLQIDGDNYASGLVYDPAGRFASITVGPAGPQQTVETYGYDPATGLLTSQQIDRGGTPLFGLGYTYWPNRQLYQRTENPENGGQLRFFYHFYDSVDRLRTMTKPAPLPGPGPRGPAPVRQATPPPASNEWFEQYTFDEYGNRTAVTANVFPLDGLPSLTYEPKTNHVTGFSYDEAGNLTRGQRADGSWLRYQYDQAGRLVTVTDDSGQRLESYGYGADGRRLVTTQAGNSTYCLWDRGNIVAEYAQVTATELAWTRSRVYLGNRILASFMPAQPGQSGETVYYHHPDRLGTCLITNNTDNTVWEQATLPFGTLSPFSTPNPVNPTFTTYDRSPATGTDYAVNRTYDPGLRFMQPDPVVITNLRDPRSLNLYSYVRNDPINRTDPAGLQDDLVSIYDPGEDVPVWIDLTAGPPLGPTLGTPAAGQSLSTPERAKAAAAAAAAKALAERMELYTVATGITTSATSDNSVVSDAKAAGLMTGLKAAAHEAAPYLLSYSIIMLMKHSRDQSYIAASWNFISVVRGLASSMGVPEFAGLGSLTSPESLLLFAIVLWDMAWYKPAIEGAQEAGNNVQQSIEHAISAPQSFGGF
jgi:RHS repeat-associated protein